MGFFYRTIRMVENGIKPAYVFDGKPPELKSGVVSPLPATQKKSMLKLTLGIVFSLPSGLRDGKKLQSRVKKLKKLVCLNFCHF